MFYIYILYSRSSDLHYVGYTSDPWRRVIEHNSTEFTTFTSKHRPWELKAVFECSQRENEAIRMERFIKKQKSRRFLELLCQPDFIPGGIMVQLVRVPQMRD